MLQVAAISNEDRGLFLPFLTPEVGDLLMSGFPMTALGLLDDETACGILTGFLESSSTFRINGLYVAPGFRRRGGAALLLQTLGDLLEPELQVTDVVASYAETSPDVALLTPLFKSAGFVEEEGDSVLYGISLGEVCKGAFFTASGDSSGSRLLPFASIPELYIRQLDHLFRRKDLPLLNKPLTKAPMDRDVSVGYYAENAIQAFILFVHHMSGVLNLAYAYTGSGKAASRLFPSLLRKACRLAAGKYPPDTLLTIEAVNQISASLVERILRDTNYRILSHNVRLKLERLPIQHYLPVL